MVTALGTLLNFLQAEWNLAAPVSASDLVFSEGWYNMDKHEYLQVTATPLTKPVLQRFKSSNKMVHLVRELCVFNVWLRIPAGHIGSSELGSVSLVAAEVAECFRRGYETNYGGSLSPFGVVLPVDNGVDRHELNRTPRIARVEVTVVATEHFSA